MDQLYQLLRVIDQEISYLQENQNANDNLSLYLTKSQKHEEENKIVEHKLKRVQTVTESLIFQQIQRKNSSISQLQEQNTKNKDDAADNNEAELQQSTKQRRRKRKNNETVTDNGTQQLGNDKIQETNKTEINNDIAQTVENQDKDTRQRKKVRKNKKDKVNQHQDSEDLTSASQTTNTTTEAFATHNINMNDSVESQNQFRFSQSRFNQQYIKSNLSITQVLDTSIDTVDDDYEMPNPLSPDDYVRSSSKRCSVVQNSVEKNDSPLHDTSLVEYTQQNQQCNIVQIQDVSISSDSNIHEPEGQIALDQEQETKQEESQENCQQHIVEQVNTDIHDNVADNIGNSRNSVNEVGNEDIVADVPEDTESKINDIPNIQTDPGTMDMSKTRLDLVNCQAYVYARQQQIKSIVEQYKSLLFSEQQCQDSDVLPTSPQQLECDESTLDEIETKSYNIPPPKPTDVVINKDPDQPSSEKSKVSFQATAVWDVLSGRDQDRVIRPNASQYNQPHIQKRHSKNIFLEKSRQMTLSTNQKSMTRNSNIFSDCNKMTQANINDTELKADKQLACSGYQASQIVSPIRSLKDQDISIEQNTTDIQFFNNEKELLPSIKQPLSPQLIYYELLTQKNDYHDIDTYEDPQTTFKIASDTTCLNQPSSILNENNKWIQYQNYEFQKFTQQFANYKSSD